LFSDTDTKVRVKGKAGERKSKDRRENKRAAVG